MKTKTQSTRNTKAQTVSTQEFKALRTALLAANKFLTQYGYGLEVRAKRAARSTKVASRTIRNVTPLRTAA